MAVAAWPPWRHPQTLSGSLPLHLPAAHECARLPAAPSPTASPPPPSFSAHKPASPAPLALPATQDWHSCRGTRPDSRGYTCGLWQLFHVLASRLPECVGRGGHRAASGAWLVHQPRQRPFDRQLPLASHCYLLGGCKPTSYAPRSAPPHPDSVCSTENAGAVWLAAVKGFVMNFFQVWQGARGGTI